MILKQFKRRFKNYQTQVEVICNKLIADIEDTDVDDSLADMVQGIVANITTAIVEPDEEEYIPECSLSRLNELLEELEERDDEEENEDE